MSDITRRGFLSLFTKTAALLAVAPLVLPKLALAEPQVVRRESGIYVVSGKEPLRQPDANVPLGHRLVGRSGTITFSRGGEVYVIEPYRAWVDQSRSHPLAEYPWPLDPATGWAESFVPNDKAHVRCLMDSLLAHRENQEPWDFSWADLSLDGKPQRFYRGKVFVKSVKWVVNHGEPIKSQVAWDFVGSAMVES